MPLIQDVKDPKALQLSWNLLFSLGDRVDVAIHSKSVAQERNMLLGHCVVLMYIPHYIICFFVELIILQLCFTKIIIKYMLEMEFYW